MQVVPGLCVATLGSMVFVLGVNVSLNRRKLRISGVIPADNNNAAYIASRAHGNAIEFIPTVLGLILYISSFQGFPSWMNYAMIGFTLSRFVYTYGILGYSTMSKPNLPRKLGATGTFLFGVILSGCAGYLALQ